MSAPEHTSESRIAELETRLAFQDDLIDSLNGVVARQDRELLELARRIEALESKIDDLAEASSSTGGQAGHELPPHY